jgi:hypothetical protein
MYLGGLDGCDAVVALEQLVLVLHPHRLHHHRDRKERADRHQTTTRERGRRKEGEGRQPLNRTKECAGR